MSPEINILTSLQGDSYTDKLGTQTCWGMAGERSRKSLLYSGNNGSLESDKRCRDKANTATSSTCLLESVGGPKTRADVEMGKRC